MEGCSAPLVVKFADTQKEKDAKRIQALQSSLWNFASNINSPMTPSPVPIASPIQSNMPQAQSSPFLASDAVSTSSLQLLQQLQAIGLQQQLLHGMRKHLKNQIRISNELFFFVQDCKLKQKQHRHNNRLLRTFKLPLLLVF